MHRFGLTLIAVCLAVMAYPTSGQRASQTSARATIRFEKTRFLAGENIFAWIGVSRTDSPIPMEVRDSGRVIMTRPDGTVRTDHVRWPIDGNTDLGGWEGGWGLGSEPVQFGRYTVIAEFAGKQSKPQTFTVEDSPILKSIHGEFVFPSPLTFNTSDRVVFRIRNNSSETIRFAHRGQLSEDIWAKVEKRTDPRFSGSFFVPESVLVKATGARISDLFSASFTWDLVERVPTVTLRPGESHMLELPVSSLLPDWTDSFRIIPGEYDIELGTLVHILVGDRNGPWKGISPIRLSFSGSAHGTVK